MKRRIFAKQFIRIVILFLVVNACNYTGPCSDCYEEKPSVGLLTVYVSHSNTHDSIPIKIFKGKLEDEELYLQDTLSESKVDFWVEVGSYYTVVASYNNSDQIILAVDGDKVSVFLDQSNCDEACWRPNDGKVNCELN